MALFGSEPFSSHLRMSHPNYKYDWYWDKGQGTGFLNCKKMPLKNVETISIFQKTIHYNPQMRTGFKPYKVTRGKGSSLYGTQSDSVTVNTDGTRYPLTLLKFNKDFENYHSCQKPLALMEYLIKSYTNENDVILDPFMGSGTTGVACKKLNRHFIGIEIDEKYFKIAEGRINAI